MFLSQDIWLESLYLSNLPANYIVQEFSHLNYMFTLVNHHYITAYVINNPVLYKSKEYSFVRDPLQKIAVWISEDK